ncbi:MAG: hypothetical protein AAFY20_11615 [Cyanobacteria bacterium J06639_14]
MATTIVNLTQQSVDRKIDETIAQNSDGFDSEALTDTDFRDKLTAYVLSRVNNCYVSVEVGQEAMLNDLSVSTPAQCDQLDCLIHQGLNKLLKAPEDWVQQHLTRVMRSPRVETQPSYWFG